MKIAKYHPPHKQSSIIGNSVWSVARLITLSKELPVMDVPLDHLNIYHRYKELSIKDMVMHIQAVLDADLSYPIILDEEGDIMDGRHRIMKALLTGVQTIKAVRFDENPSPCQIREI